MNGNTLPELHALKPTSHKLIQCAYRGQENDTDCTVEFDCQIKPHKFAYGETKGQKSGEHIKLLGKI